MKETEKAFEAYLHKMCFEENPTVLDDPNFFDDWLSNLTVDQMIRHTANFVEDDSEHMDIEYEIALRVAQVVLNKYKKEETEQLFEDWLQEELEGRGTI